MSPTPDDLTIIKDDMIAFIEGHGMSRFHGYVDYEEVQCVMWEMGDNPDGWKDFVELAKSAGAPFLTMHAWKLEREELDGTAFFVPQCGQYLNMGRTRWLHFGHSAWITVSAGTTRKISSNAVVPLRSFSTASSSIDRMPLALEISRTCSILPLDRTTVRIASSN